MDEIVKDFLIESTENLDRLDQELVKLESAPSSPELLSSIFRTIHTIKGTCGFLGFGHLQKLTHAGENLLMALRDGELLLNAEIASGLLAMVDAIRKILGHIEASGSDGTDDHRALIDQLKELQSPIAAQSAAAQQSPDTSRIGGLLFERGQLRAEDLAAALEVQELGRKRIGEILIEQGAVLPEDLLAAQRTLDARNPESGAATIRVSVILLERLMNLVGELVLARNQLVNLSGNSPDAALAAVSQRMNVIATELQQEVMKTRMQPIRNLWNKFPRVIRDLGVSCGKDVRLMMQGQDTELDRTVLEGIRDPLMHLVRNALDHGIELPEVRAKAGKQPCGVLHLRAFHSGGQVHIEVGDDGAGLNPDRIREKAVERGLVSEQQSSRMPERELWNLIFLPGFSTANQVTSVSGRGVGMDVVKTNVEKIGGAVELQSTPGKGTIVKIKIPLTLAIIPALLVTSRAERFAIPQASLVELVRWEAGDAGKCIEFVHGAPVYRLRGRLLPLIYLDRLLQLEDRTSSDAARSETTNIVVLQADGREFGLVVDEITDSEEIVVKPLGPHLNAISIFAGATILGDGHIALILDVLGVAQKAHAVSEVRDSALPESDGGQAPSIQDNGSERASLLIVQCGPLRRVGIPLPLVSRLEEFPAEAIEFAGAQPVVQYQQQIMPLVRLSHDFPSANHRWTEVPPEGGWQVVVYSEQGRSIGLVVDRIVDIVEQPLSALAPAFGPGVLGAAVIQRSVTDLLDVESLVRDAIAGFTAVPGGVPASRAT